MIGAVTLQNATRGGTLTASRTQQRLIERRFGDAIRELFGVDVAALTAPEAQYIGNFRDADALRTRGLAARRQREQRLSAKGLSEPSFSRVTSRDRSAIPNEPSESSSAHTQAIADKIQDLNAIMAQQEELANGFQYSSSGDQGVIDAYQQVFGVDVVPIAPTGDVSSGFNGVQYHGTRFVDTNANKGFVHIAAHELLHQIRRDSLALYRWFWNRPRITVARMPQTIMDAVSNRIIMRSVKIAWRDYSDPSLPCWKERPMPSPETSNAKPRIGKIELDYLTRIGAAMQNPVQSSTVKMWLTEACEKGLDPEALYERAVGTRPPHWTPAPPFSDVAPDKLVMMRKIPHIAHLNSDLSGPISKEEIRYDLTVAQADGFDPKDLYEKCVQAKSMNGETKYPAPPYSEVDPNA